MSVIGALIGLAGTVASGVMSAKNNQRMRARENEEFNRQQAYYRIKANENPLARSENQRIIHQYDRQADNQLRRARDMSAITGATPEYGLAVQNNITQSKADLLSNIAGNASEREDKYNNLAEESRQSHTKAVMDMDAARNESYANLAANAASALGGIVDSGIGSASSNGKLETPQHLEPQQKGLQVGSAPTTITDAQAKVNTGLAKIKQQNGW